MGLDQLAFKTKQQFSSEVDFDNEIKVDDVIEIMCWRKHPYLQGFMTELYYKKGGEELSFNQVPLTLTEDDLLELKKLVINKSLPITYGFFWGGDRSDDYYDKDLEFIENAIRSIKNGYTVFYTSWW